MKKILIVVVVLLLSLTLLTACENNANKIETANVPIYYNLSRETQPAQSADGTYLVEFALKNEKKTFRVADEALFTSLMRHNFVGLTLEGDIITGFDRVFDLPYQRIASDAYVQSIGGNKIKINAMASYAGREILIDIPENFPVYDITPQAAQFGAAATMQKNDRVSVIADKEGNLLYAYITSRPAVPHEGKRYCSHCDSEVSWLDWVSASTMPTNSGHYLLTQDVNLAAGSSISGGQVCLDLNGKTVTMTKEDTRIYMLGGSGTLSIMDSVGGGTLIPANAGSTGSVNTGMVVYVNSYDATLNLYSGTLDASNCTAKYGHGVRIKTGTFNMYGGEILGGFSDSGPGSTCVSANGTFNMYGGKLVGGKCTNTQYTNPIGGAVVRVMGVTTIYDGEIIGGESAVNGGLIRVSGDVYGLGKLVLKGGSFTGGIAPVGGGIYVASNSELVVSGDVKITDSTEGNIYFASGSEFSIGDEGLGENAQMSIAAEEASLVVENVPEDLDISKYIACEQAGKKLTKQSDGTWIMK